MEKTDEKAEVYLEGIYNTVIVKDIEERQNRREMRPLRKVKDNYEKIVLTLDRFTVGNYDGIKVINVIDWLLNN